MKNEKKFKTALVIGAGAFGTSIACVLAQNFEEVIIKVRSVDIFDSLQKNENEVYLPGVKLPTNIKPIFSWQELALASQDQCQIIVSGLPTQGIKSFHQEHHDVIFSWLKKGIPFICLAKGIDADTLHLSDDLYQEIYPQAVDQLCFLSGPSFAKEIVSQQITCVSLAGKSRSVLIDAVKMLSTSYFRVFPTYDVKGVLLGGALKNVLAIAGGIVEGLGFNHNTRAAMITRGIEEMLRFGVVFNARPETFYGFSGMGDLILTTTGEQSRNKMFGLSIAKGLTPKQILNNQRFVVEGLRTSLAAYRMSQSYDIKTKIFDGVYKILYENVSPMVVIEKLMSAPIKFGHTYIE